MSSQDSSPARSAYLGRIAAQLAAGPEPLLPLACFDSRERWYGQLYAQPDHEAWLLSWLPGQRTGLHDHGGSAGAFTVVTGTLTETTVTLPAAGQVTRRPHLVTRTLAAGRVRSFGPEHVHEIVNSGDQPAVQRARVRPGASPYAPLHRRSGGRSGADLP